MIAGIELFALGVEQVVGHVDETLEPEAAAALFGGVALYLLAHVAFKLRTTGERRRPAPVAALLCVACIPLGADVNATPRARGGHRDLGRADRL